jgi:hypothetical protein
MKKFQIAILPNEKCFVMNEGVKQAEFDVARAFVAFLDRQGAPHESR